MRKTPEALLNELFEDFRFSGMGVKPDLFVETTLIAGLQTQLVGLSSTTPDGRCVTASAASLGEYPVKRAFFELIERLSILAHQGTSSSGTNWRYSLSNGVAAHTQKESAQASAAAELIERDRVLGSWYGRNKPIRLNSSVLEKWAKTLASECDIGAYLFQNGPNDPFFVTGVFGIPAPTSSLPGFYGLGCSTDAQLSLLHAHQEALQMLGFLVGETSSQEEIPVADPAFHQNFYLDGKNHPRIRAWLDGDHTQFWKRKKSRDTAELEPELKITDLSPLDARDRFYVIKAESKKLIPLTFGYCPDYAPREFPKELLIHPIT